SREVVTSQHYDVLAWGWKNVFEDHGVGVSPDGKWIYLPTGEGTFGTMGFGHLLIINARTLKLDKVLHTNGKSAPCQGPEHAGRTPLRHELRVGSAFVRARPRAGQQGGRRTRLQRHRNRYLSVLRLTRWAGDHRWRPFPRQRRAQGYLRQHHGAHQHQGLEGDRRYSDPGEHAGLGRFQRGRQIRLLHRRGDEPRVQV